MSEGNTEIAIGEKDGRTVLRFPHPVTWAALDPSNAVQIGKAIIDSAVRCGANVEIQVQRRKISEDRRDHLIARASHVIRSLYDQQRTPGQAALQIVDLILSEVK